LAPSIVMAVQLATVWLTLRTSQAHRVARLLAGIVLCLAAVVAVVSWFAHQPGNHLGGIFAAWCLLYLIARGHRHLPADRHVLRLRLQGGPASSAAPACGRSAALRAGPAPVPRRHRSRPAARPSAQALAGR
jgi:hypothetical protein